MKQAEQIETQKEQLQRSKKRTKKQKRNFHDGLSSIIIFFNVFVV